MSRRLAIGAVAVTVALAASLRWWRPSGEDAPLPASMTIEDFVVDLTPDLTGDSGVTTQTIEPGDMLTSGGKRAALVVRPPATLAASAAVPAGAILRFAIGVASERKRQSGRSTLRFTVRADDVEIYRRDVNPTATRHDRRWFDERVPLPSSSTPATRFAFTVTALDPAAPPAGTPAWNYVRLVREETRTRQPPSAGPNVLVLLVDTLRASRLGCYGAAPSPSPTLDALAAGGILFEQSISTAPWTLPSTASILSGLPARSHGLLGDSADGRHDDDVPDDGSFLSDSITTFAESAARAGITTVGVSSNPLVSRTTNLAQGFETFVQYDYDPKARNWAGAAAKVNGSFLRWLDRNPGYRFLAYLHYMDVHDPYTPAVPPAPPPGAPLPKSIANGWVNDIAKAIIWHDAPPLPEPQIAHLRALYDAEIRGWDEELARLLDGLGARGLRDRTVVVMTADHGEEFQDHGLLKHGQHLYDETIRVPLILSGTGLPAARIATQVQGIDVFPTVAAVLGVPPPAGLPGLSLLGSLPDRPLVVETAFAREPGAGTMHIQAVRTPQWKLIEAPRTNRIETYDLVADPAERESRPDPDRDAGLRAALARVTASAPSPPRASGVRHDVREHLRDLGYVE